MQSMFGSLRAYEGPTGTQVIFVGEVGGRTLLKCRGRERLTNHWSYKIKVCLHVFQGQYSGSLYVIGHA